MGSSACGRLLSAGGNRSETDGARRRPRGPAYRRSTFYEVKKDPAKAGSSVRKDCFHLSGLILLLQIFL